MSQKAITAPRAVYIAPLTEITTLVLDGSVLASLNAGASNDSWVEEDFDWD